MLKLMIFFFNRFPNNDPKSDRKPSPIMINNAIKKYDLQRKNCFLIGDKLSDIKSAENAGIKRIFFLKR